MVDVDLLDRRNVIETPADFDPIAELAQGHRDLHPLLPLELQQGLALPVFLRLGRENAHRLGQHRTKVVRLLAGEDRKNPRLNPSHYCASRMPSSACTTKNQKPR